MTQDTQPFATLERGDYVWLKGEPWRFTVIWCHPDHSGIELEYPPEANEPPGVHHCVGREDIKRASRPEGKPYMPPIPFEPPF